MCVCVCVCAHVWFLFHAKQHVAAFCITLVLGDLIHSSLTSVAHSTFSLLWTLYKCKLLSSPSVSQLSQILTWSSAISKKMRKKKIYSEERQVRARLLGPGSHSACHIEPCKLHSGSLNILQSGHRSHWRVLSRWRCTLTCTFMNVACCLLCRHGL